MKKVFLSHSSHDSDLSYMLAHVLGEEGFSLFRSDSLLAGDEWRSEILSAIRRSNIFIAAMDDLNPNVLFELGYALGAGKNVLLLRSPNTKLPFDVSSLPVKTIDRFDLTTAGEIAQWVRSVRDDVPAMREFDTARQFLEAILRDPEFLDTIPPREFETQMARFFQELEFATEMPPGNDQGFDILLTDGESNSRIVVVLKKYNRNSRVSVSDVHRIVGSAVIADATSAMIVSTGSFTSSAHHFSQSSPLPVKLIELDELLTLDKRRITM